MDLDAAADELYAISPDDFMARRTALVAEVKKAGDKALAKQIGALRKPTRSAWLVNLVARAEPEQVAGLIALAGELQSAQAAMNGDALRTLSKQRRTRIDALARRAVVLGREAGYAAADGSLAEVGSTLQAVLGDPAVAEQVRAGRLAQAVAYGGFGALATAGGGDDLTSALAASMPAKPERKLKAVPPLPPDAEEAENEDEVEPEAQPDPEAVERARRLRAEADEAAAALRAAETTADEATTRADELADEVEALRNRLKDTEVAEREAREDARAARKALTEARRTAAVARQAASRAENAR